MIFFSIKCCYKTIFCISHLVLKDSDNSKLDQKLFLLIIKLRFLCRLNFFTFDVLFTIEHCTIFLLKKCKKGLNLSFGYNQNVLR
jgi:hypothetical protein